MSSLSNNLNKYTSISNVELLILKELTKMFELEEPEDREDKELRIKTCDWMKFKDFIIDVFQKGVHEGRKRENLDIRKLINKKNR